MDPATSCPEVLIYFNLVYYIRKLQIFCWCIAEVQTNALYISSFYEHTAMYGTVAIESVLTPEEMRVYKSICPKAQSVISSFYTS